MARAGKSIVGERRRPAFSGALAEPDRTPAGIGSHMATAGMRAGLVAATVTTAGPIPRDVHDRLEGTLSSLTGKKVRIDFATDPELIGGVVTRIGSTVYDGSVRNQLQQIKERMTR